MNGKEGRFIGLIPLVCQYLDSMEMRAEERDTIDGYLRLISGRASGQVSTGARYDLLIRKLFLLADVACD